MTKFVCYGPGDARTFDLYDFANPTAQFFNQTETGFSVSYNGNNVTVVGGSGFAYDPSTGAPVTGTTTSGVRYVDGAPFGYIYDISITSEQAQIYIGWGDPQRVNQDVFKGNDEITGSKFSDYLDGWAGADRFSGGLGDDTYIVDNVGDTVFEESNSGNDTVLSTVSYTLAAGQQVETLQLAPSTGSAALNLTGNEFVNTLIGNAGSNVLNGRGGADILKGMGGNDVYAVDNVGDQVIEASGGGSDTVVATVGYALAAGQEIETLQLASSTGGAALNLSGNAFANTLIGNAGSNVLNGGAGADILKGMGGNDVYAVDNVGDQVIEASGGGSDTVVATIGYTLTAGQEIETLQLASSTGSTALNLTGNAIANTLIGNAGSNVLNGGAGSDVLKGMGGNDVYAVDNVGDQVVEASGGGNDTVVSTVSYTLAVGQEIEALQLASSTGSAALNLTGNAFSNIIRGNAGGNVIDGGAGADTLYGNAGADIFVFKTALGSTNIDHIADFVSSTTAVHDTVQLAKSIFANLAAGELAETAFKETSAGAVDETDRILYNKTTGILSYDADGSGAASTAVQFAVLDNKAIVNFHDFFVV